MSDWGLGLLGFLGLAAALSAFVVLLVLPGLVMFWLMALKLLRFPKVVALWEKWELEWEHPKTLVMLAKTADRLNTERSEKQSALLKLSIGSPEWKQLSDELEGDKIELNKNNYYLAQAVISHLKKLEEIK